MAGGYVHRPFSCIKKMLAHMISKFSRRNVPMDIRNLKGSIVALVTPFHDDGSVNF